MITKEDSKNHVELVRQVASIAHEANRAYCISIGDYSQVSWEDAPVWQRHSAEQGVSFALQEEVTPEQMHENWMTDKISDGWVYGEVKDPNEKTHPCLVPYEQLSEDQRIKDALFANIVKTFK